jgi:hypothetical protein
VTCGRDGGNPSPAAGLSLLTIAGVGARDWWIELCVGSHD